MAENVSTALLFLFVLLLASCNSDNSDSSPTPLAQQPNQLTTQPSIYESIDTKNIRAIFSHGFTLWLDCTKKAAYQFKYSLTTDNGNIARSSSFKIDQDNANCQQTSTGSYKVTGGTTYDRGHLVPANHMDNNATSIKQTNYMVNILPQLPNMNRGAWLQTEEISECYRDINNVHVYGGALWEKGKTNNYFKASHGIETPSSFWKILIFEDQIIAWIIPNSQAAKRSQLNSYLVKPQELLDELKKINVEFNIGDISSLSVATKSWALPKGCDRS
jgi:endonuclease G, mitochondrial